MIVLKQFFITLNFFFSHHDSCIVHIVNILCTHLVSNTHIVNESLYGKCGECLISEELPDSCLLIDTVS